MSANNGNDDKNRIQDTSNNLEGLKTSPRRIRTAYMRERMISTLGAMLDQGATVDQICQTLQISQSTFYKWHDLLAEQQRKVIDQRFEKEVLVNLRNSYNMMSKTINVLASIENDAENSVIDRIEAGKLKNQLGLARIRLLREGPRAVMKELPINLKRKMDEYSRLEVQNLPQLQQFEDIKTGYESSNATEQSTTEEGDDNNAS